MKLENLLSPPEQQYLADLTIRLLTNIELFEFSDTDKYALKAIIPKISVCMDLEVEEYDILYDPEFKADCEADQIEYNNQHNQGEEGND